MKPNAPSPSHPPGGLSRWLRPLPLPGGRELPNHILPGPMEGITRGSFCTVMAERGLVRCWITPFIRVSVGVPGRGRLRERLREFMATGLPAMVQLMGTDIPTLSATAARLLDLGVAGIDLNCACPARKVLRNGAGGGRLRELRWIREAVAALRRVCRDNGLSVKLRTGYDHPSELPAIMEAVRAGEPDYVVLHYRTVTESYRAVESGWDRLAQARERFPDVRLLASGDLFSVRDAVTVGRRTGVDGVAPARGILRNPWLLRDIEEACGGRLEDERVSNPVCAPAGAATEGARRMPRASLSCSGPENRSRIGFLRDVALRSRRAETARPGFVLELARHLLGPEHRHFAELSACPTLAAARALLNALPPRQ